MYGPVPTQRTSARRAAGAADDQHAATPGARPRCPRTRPLLLAGLLLCVGYCWVRIVAFTMAEGDLAASRLAAQSEQLQMHTLSDAEAIAPPSETPSVRPPPHPRAPPHPPVRTACWRR